MMLRIAVVSEVSAVQRNAALIEALSGRGCVVVNAAMRSKDDRALTYIHTGLMAALLLNARAVDMVVGGCGTGQGFLLSAMQYPGIQCGLIAEPVDAWLFSKINAGNCLSLPLNKGFGWAGEIVLSQIFDAWFSPGFGEGYPKARQVPQSASRAMLNEVSQMTHRSMEDICHALPGALLAETLSFPGFMFILERDGHNPALIELLRAIESGREG